MRVFFLDGLRDQFVEILFRVVGSELMDPDRDGFGRFLRRCGDAGFLRGRASSESDYKGK
jgi:hypothetical protein